MRKTIETRKFTLPELVESGDETDSACESDQEYRVRRASHRPNKADDTPEKEKFDVLKPSGKVLSEDLWPRSVTEIVDGISCIERKEVMNTDSPNINGKIEFKTGRKPKEAIEGDLIRFMHKDHERNSVSWVQGRLVSRIDSLDDAVESEWAMNRFRVDTINTIAHWGVPGIPPSSTTVSVSYGTKWILGIRGDQLSGANDGQIKKLYLGYYEATCMNLA